MEFESLHIIAQEELKKCEENAGNHVFAIMKFCKSMAEIDPIICLEWAFELVKNEISEREKDQLINDTIKEIELALQQSSKEQMLRLDEFAKKNWREREYVEAGNSIKVGIAGLCWASMGLLSLRDGISNGFNPEINKVNLIFHESARAILNIFGKQKEKLIFVAESFSNKMHITVKQ